MLKLQSMEAGYGESMVIRDVNLEVRPGQIVCLMGRNGVGKSTLMKSIMGLIKPRSGTIHYHGRRHHVRLHQIAAPSQVSATCRKAVKYFLNLPSRKIFYLGLEAAIRSEKETARHPL